MPASATAVTSIPSAESARDPRRSAHTPAERKVLLGIIVADSRKDDALTLWHLLSRVTDEVNRSIEQYNLHEGSRHI